MPFIWWPSSPDTLPSLSDEYFGFAARARSRDLSVWSTDTVSSLPVGEEPCECQPPGGRDHSRHVRSDPRVRLPVSLPRTLAEAPRGPRVEACLRAQLVLWARRWIRHP